jgi:steroid delta-isomerase
MVIDEVVRKELAMEHCRRMNTGNVGHMLELYTEDVRFTDPVGAPPMIGREALRTHFTRAMEAGTVDIPGIPVAAQDGRHAVLPVTVMMQYLPLGPVLASLGYLTPPPDPLRRQIRFNITGVFHVNDDHLIDAAWVYWGKTDLAVVSAT